MVLSILKKESRVFQTAKIATLNMLVTKQARLVQLFLALRVIIAKEELKLENLVAVFEDLSSTKEICAILVRFALLKAVRHPSALRDTIVTISLCQ